jgi:hypothetical protein
MVPPTILRQLNRLRGRERLLRLTWGASRWLAVVVVAVAVACLVDWWVDRSRDTPFALRVTLVVAQVALAAVLGVVWLLAPIVRRRSDDDLALFVENREPDLHHQLISAVQLNRPGADTFGMSPAMIAAVTRQADERSGRIDFAAFAEHSRVRQALYITVGVVAFAGLAYGFGGDTVSALIGRQLLHDTAIPRRVTLDNRTNAVWPSGEPVTVSIGYVNTAEDEPAGRLHVAYDDGMAVDLPIAGGPHGGVATAKVPTGTAGFTFQAWLGDGRLHEPGQVRRVPRPAVVEQKAWVQLPAHCGSRPDGKPYEMTQPRGEVIGLPGSSARVALRFNKPITQATVELLGPAKDVEATKGVRQEAVFRSVPLVLDEGGSVAGGAFELQAAETAYRLVVADEHGFANLDPPRRGLRIIPEEAPTVTLLPEHFLPDQLALVGGGPSEDFEVEGVPIPLGGAIRVAFVANHPYGLGTARLYYRVNDGAWWPYELADIPSSEATGPFDARRGAFANSRPTDQVQFHAVPSADPFNVPGRLEGGGRFDFQTRALQDLKVGDQIEYYVEVTNREPGAPKGGRSEVRMKAVVTQLDLVKWIDATLRQEDRIRQLELRQRGVFGSGDPIRDRD